MTVSYNIEDEYPDYDPNSAARGVVDTYDVVLSEPPSDTVVLDITAQVTRSLNSDLRFNELFNFGESNKKEVLAATPQAKITIDGPAIAGETWAISLSTTDTDIEYVVGTAIAGYTGDLLTPEAVAAGLNAELAAQAPNYTVTLAGASLQLNLTTPFTADLTPGASGTGTSSAQLVFTTHDSTLPTHWSKPRTVTVHAINDAIIDGGDVKVFAAFGQRVNTIRGPLSIDGGVRFSSDALLARSVYAARRNQLPAARRATRPGRHGRRQGNHHRHRRVPHRSN